MNAKFYELHNLITKIVEDDSWACLGIRSTHHTAESEINYYHDDSSIWFDEIYTEDKLDGTCSIGICPRSYNEESLIDIIQKHGENWCDYFGVAYPKRPKAGYGDIDLILIQGDCRTTGEDDGEDIIRDAKTIWSANND